ncbi:hypothetical protein NL676_029050 [Syzygium grande]|nr:hypothetical protein NL676_029050 [Syzygium grande]
MGGLVRLGAEGRRHGKYPEGRGVLQALHRLQPRQLERRGSIPFQCRMRPLPLSHPEEGNGSFGSRRLVVVMVPGVGSVPVTTIAAGELMPANRVKIKWSNQHLLLHDVVAQICHARSLAEKLKPVARMMKLDGGHLVSHERTKEVKDSAVAYSHKIFLKYLPDLFILEVDLIEVVVV